MRSAADWRLGVVFGAAAGLALAQLWSPGQDWLRPLAALALVTLVLSERGRAGPLGLVLISLAAALAGLLVGGARLEAIDNGSLEVAPGPVSLSGFVLEPPSESRGTFRFAFGTDRGRLLVETADGEVAGLLPGTGLDLRGQIGRPPDWMRGDLKRRGIGMVLHVEAVARNGQTRGGLAGVIDGLRARATDALGAAIPEREAALSRGFVLGDDSEIDPRTTEDFRNSGLAHLLAVSGQNVVLLALLAVPFLSLLGVAPRARLLMIGLLILVYVPLAGGGPSIQRAGVMGLAGLVALAATRAPSRLYALGAAALVTLVLNPRATGDIGWQLSFAAVVGIMLLAHPLSARFEPLIGTGGWRRALCEGMAVTVSATIATAPLIAFHFEQLPVATLAANLAALPAVAPAMWAGMISVAAGQISPSVAVPFNLAGSVFLGWIAQVAEWFGRPDWAVIEVTLDSTPMLISTLAALAAFSFLLTRIWRVSPVPVPPGRWLPAVLSLVVALIMMVPGLAGSDRRELAEPPPGGARVEILDVGQGDAILIRPSGSDPILIDGGPPGGDLPGALDSAGVDRLEAVLLTHPDLDHYGGLAGIFGLLPVGRFLYDQATPELIALARRSGAKPERVGEGTVLGTRELRLEILWPPARDSGDRTAGEESETNLRSIVALLSWHGFRLLLTGDAEAGSVPMHPGPLDVLKVAHHGSEDTGLPALLRETSPRLAVIPVGEDNRFGHPVDQVLDGLATSRVDALRTDRDGTVSIVLGADDGSFRVETGK